MAETSKIIFNMQRCKGCGLCVPACPGGNIRMSGQLGPRGYPYAELISPGKCSRCGQCFIMCPDVAIEIPCKPEKPTADDDKGL